MENNILKIRDHYFRFSRDSPGFMIFKQFCPVAGHNAVRDAKCPGFFQVMKIRTDI